jgi:nucleoside 2-deoxyribosyltransferase
VRPPTTVTAYLAGPDVFLRNAVEHTTRRVAICQRFSFRGLPLLNQDVETAPRAETWQAIFEKDTPMMERSQPHPLFGEWPLLARSRRSQFDVMDIY